MKSNPQLRPKYHTDVSNCAEQILQIVDHKNITKNFLAIIVSIFRNENKHFFCNDKKKLIIRICFKKLKTKTITNNQK